MSETCTTLWNGSEMIGGDTAADASNIVYTNAANIRQTVKGALDNGAMIKMPYEEYKSLSEEERNAGVYEVTGCPDSYADRVMLLETQAEYDALTEAEKLNGTSYFVKEGPDQFDAKNIHYSDPTGETTNVGDALSNLNNSLNGFKFRINPTTGKEQKSSDGGATWSNFSGGVYYLGTGTSFNVKNLFPNDYANLTTANFIVEPYAIYGRNYNEFGSNPVYAGPVLNTNGLNYSKSYNASTGVLSVAYGGSISGGVKYGGDNNAGYIYTHAISTSFKAYLVLSDIETA